MKQFILKHKKNLAGILAILLIGGITMSFQDSPFAYSRFSVQEEYEPYRGCTDTVPERNAMTMKEFDKLQLDLDKSLLQVNDELKKMDFSKIQKDIEASLKSVDMEKIKKDVELSLKSIDMDKMMAEVSNSLKNINLTYNEVEIEKALAEAKKEIDKARIEINNINKEEIQKELAQAGKEIEKARKEIDKIDLDKIMSEATESINKAKTELNLTKDMFTEMRKDGLINSKKGFTIEYKNKELFIDSKKQPANVTDKYRRYFKKDHFNMIIEKE